MKNAVEVDSLRKVYRGKPVDFQAAWSEGLLHTLKNRLEGEQMVALDSVELEVRAGELFGVIGSNGAGKTTLLKLLACLLYPDGGTARVNGFDIKKQRTNARRSVVAVKAQGWLGLLWQLTGRQNLIFQAMMCGLSAGEAAERVDQVISTLELSGKAGDYSWNWSAGELQKFNLAMSMVARTPVVLFDEPTAHLDPRVAGQVRRLMKECLNEVNGQTVIMSSHYLDEADLLCDRVAIIEKGKIIACDAPTILKQRYCKNEIHEVWVENFSADLIPALKKSAGIQGILEHYEDPAAGKARLRIYWMETGPRMPRLLSRLEATGVKARKIALAPPSLDDVYFHLTKGKIT